MNQQNFSSDAPDAATTTFVRARHAAARLLGKMKRHKAERSPAEGRVFQDGQIVGQRFRIRGFLGRGGVGQVYEAQDLELGERVALKTLHPTLAASRGALEQFKQEVLLARTVTHENVCRLLEFGRHQAEPDGECLFVTMELLEGETLDTYLRRKGRLELSEALDIAAQIALGLRAAHRRGVIHRDVKGSNVFLCRRYDGSTRAVVTDFGLAVGTASEKPGASVPSPSSFQGTPLFMAPEQVRGEEVSAAADVYAWGVLLYHMVTGDWPFVGKTAVSTALLRIDADPVPPSKRVNNLDRACEALILRCLERNPDRRPASAEALLSQIDPLRGEAAPPKSRSWPMARQGLMFLVIMLLGLGIVWWMSNRRSEPSPTQQDRYPEIRPSVVVLGPDNAAGHSDLDWISTALTQVLASALAAGDGFLVIDTDEADRARRDLSMAKVIALNGEEIERLGKRSGADWVLTGSYRLSDSATGDPDLVVDLTLAGLRGEATPFTGTFHGHSSRLSDLATAAGAAIRQRFRMGSATAPQVEAAKAELPSDPRAARAYAEGLAALRRFDPQAARDQFLEAVEHENQHPLIHAGLAKAWGQIGYSRQAKEAARLAFDNAGRLSREKQLAVEAQYRMTVHQWQRAGELFRALREFFPDNLEYGLGLAGAQDNEARHEEAYATLAQLRGLPEPWGQDPRIDWSEAMIRYHAGDYPRSQELAAKAVEKARALEAKWWIASALQAQALTYIHTHKDPESVLDLLTEAEQLCEEVGNLSGQVHVWIDLGKHSSAAGELAGAETSYNKALELAQTIDNLPALAKAQTNLAILLDRRGRLQDGLELKEKVLANYRRRDIKSGVAITLENLGISLLKMGRLHEARERFEEAAREFEEAGDQIGLAWAPYWEGRVWVDLGELDLARSSFQRAIEASEKRPEGGLRTDATFELARVALAAGELDIAEERAALVLEKYERHQPLSAAEARILLARVVGQRGDRPRAMELTRDALGVFEAAAATHRVLQARFELARHLLEQTRLGGIDPALITEHCDALEDGNALKDGNALEYQRISLRARVVLARCHSQLGAGSSVALDLDEIIVEARRLGLFEPRLEAELLRAEILLASNTHQQGVTMLADLRTEVEELGWTLAAQRIDALKSSGQSP